MHPMLTERNEDELPQSHNVIAGCQCSRTDVNEKFEACGPSSGHTISSWTVAD